MLKTNGAGFIYRVQISRACLRAPQMNTKQSALNLNSVSKFVCETPLWSLILEAKQKNSLRSQPMRFPKMRQQATFLFYWSGWKIFFSPPKKKKTFFTKRSKNSNSNGSKWMITDIHTKSECKYVNTPSRRMKGWTRRGCLPMWIVPLCDRSPKAATSHVFVCWEHYHF